MEESHLVPRIILSTHFWALATVLNNALNSCNNVKAMKILIEAVHRSIYLQNSLTKLKDRSNVTIALSVKRPIAFVVTHK